MRVCLIFCDDKIKKNRMLIYYKQSKRIRKNDQKHVHHRKNRRHQKLTKKARQRGVCLYIHNNKTKQKWTNHLFLRGFDFWDFLTIFLSAICFLRNFALFFLRSFCFPSHGHFPTFSLFAYSLSQNLQFTVATSPIEWTVAKWVLSVYLLNGPLLQLVWVQ